eukprot:CAMPEP_0195508326 /NCGR_PEP_ID=MMETSP0794_2-20130614/1558_1 /TAXON_ID=515487 /ORGANISM="Stephanopyxis turris, Strain CCMP 815" /LENGTH=137 /DNA_ID=CAMNT_0040635251 /DNA_START=253 /DNA_END=666 /DNA_ORIENTATION=+
MSTLSSEEEDYCEVVGLSKVICKDNDVAQEDWCNNESGTKVNNKTDEFQSSLAKESADNNEQNTEDDSDVFDGNAKQIAVETTSHKFERNHVHMQTPCTRKPNIANTLAKVMQVQMLQRGSCRSWCIHNTYTWDEKC